MCPRINVLLAVRQPAGDGAPELAPRDVALPCGQSKARPDRTMTAADCDCTAEQLCDPLFCVRNSAQWIEKHASHVRIDHEALAVVASHWDRSGLLQSRGTSFDRQLHYVDDDRPALTVQYLLFVDALNWCFWPDHEPGAGEEAFEYEHLAGGLKKSMEADSKSLDCNRLVKLDGAGLRALLHWPRDIPCEAERVRVLRQTAGCLRRSFGGSALALVESARGSASVLVDLVTTTFPAFRDAAVYRGRHVAFMKRAQIFVGDVWGAFGGQGIGAFKDIDRLTMFADYRVPVVLRELGILRYSPHLEGLVDGCHELPAGSEEELEIRGVTIAAVELLREKLSDMQTDFAQKPNSVLIDWCLWCVLQRRHSFVCLPLTSCRLTRAILAGK